MKEDPAAQARALTRRMHAVRVHQFGGLEAIVYEEVSRPVPGAGQVLVRVKAAGVGPWDAWVRAGKSVLPQPLPLVLGSDLAGIIEEVGPGISHFRPGEAVFGVTNAQFTGAYAEYAVADAARIAPKPRRLSDVEAASVPVVASTAWQMVFDYGHLDSTKRVLVHGAAGNVGAYAVQLAKRAGAEVIATAYTHDVEEVRTLHADHVIDVQTARFEDRVKDVDVVLDTVGGETLDRSFAVLKPGGVLVLQSSGLTRIRPRDTMSAGCSFSSRSPLKVSPSLPSCSRLATSPRASVTCSPWRKCVWHTRCSPESLTSAARSS